MLRRRLSLAVLALGVLLVALAGCDAIPVGRPLPPIAAGTAPAGDPPTYRDYGDQATATLLTVFYAGRGSWRKCTDPRCRAVNRDWGVDALTYTLFLRWQTTHDARLVPYMRALAATAPVYPRPCHGLLAVRCTWSDTPEWDAIADLREHEVTGERAVLDRAIAAFRTVEDTTIYTGGACPSIRYQHPFGYVDRLKSLETEATAVRAALLLHDATGDARYLQIAIRRYAQARRYFLDPHLPLYTVYVFDNGRSCPQLPHRFFASVNGEMISDGLALFRATGEPSYLAQAEATAAAVDADLNDARGIYTDLEGDYDTVEPLIEAMDELTTDEHSALARAWLVRNAAAAVSARKPDGTFGRFFDGPPPPGMTTPWQSSGGLALMIAVGALAPTTPAPHANAWEGVRYVRRHIEQMPATLRFHGSGIALVGVLGDLCCQPGYARVFIDGRETFQQPGIWQNASSANMRIPASVLLAWRWPASGDHAIRFEIGHRNWKEGFPWLDIEGYYRLEGVGADGDAGFALTGPGERAAVSCARGTEGSVTGRGRRLPAGDRERRHARAELRPACASGRGAAP